MATAIAKIKILSDFLFFIFLSLLNYSFVFSDNKI